MEYFYIGGACIIIIFILYFILRAQAKKVYDKKYNDLVENRAREVYDEAIKKNRDVLDEVERNNQKLNDNKHELEKLLIELENKKQFNNNLLTLREEELNRIIEEKRKTKLQQLDSEVEEWAESAQEAATYEFLWQKERLNNDIIERSNILNTLKAEVNDYKEKRDAINAEILRARALNEQQDFYRIQIDDNAKHDINLINSIRPQIIKFETLNKLLYDNYISRPAKEMVKRVLEGKDPTGIYKVTNIQTQEIYIGKSTSVASRWINHIKAAEGLDGVADSQFQRALRKYGVDNFTWELLEETTKDKLTEREKYYIQFYDTTRYGYNMKVG